MRNVTLSTWIILIWFVAAILAEVIGMLTFAIWLRRRGVSLIFGLVGIPGYLEYRYARWCTSHGQSSRRVIALRLILIFNMLLAILFAFPILSAV
jgi:steroid 5-alpha reductase family enzyme